MITYIPNIDQGPGLGLELLVMIQYNIYIIYINAMGSKPGCYKYKVITMLSLNMFKTNDMNLQGYMIYN